MSDDEFFIVHLSSLLASLVLPVLLARLDLLTLLPASMRFETLLPGLEDDFLALVGGDWTLVAVLVASLLLDVLKP